MEDAFGESQLLVLELVEGDDTPFATLARALSIEDAQGAVRGLLTRGYVAVVRVVERPPGEAIDKPVSPVTPEVRSSDSQSTFPVSGDEVEAVVSDPRNWRPLEAVPVREWFAVTSTPQTMDAYRRAWEERRGLR